MTIRKTEKIQLNSREAVLWIDIRELLTEIVSEVEDYSIIELAEQALNNLNELWNDHVVDDFE